MVSKVAQNAETLIVLAILTFLMFSMSFLFLITLLNIMPNRLLLLILHCFSWVNQISWCQICAVWHLLLLVNYWRKEKLVTVHVAISAPCSKGMGSPPTQFATYSKSVPGLEDEEPVAGGWSWNPEAALEWLSGAERQEAAGGQQGTARGWGRSCTGSSWCRQRITPGWFVDGARKWARGARNFC